MIFRITSFRGDHKCEATIEDNAVSQALCEKMLGLRSEPLSDEVRQKCPDNFSELQNLWKEGTIKGYSGFTVDADKNMTPLKKFDPQAREVLLFAPIAGG